MKRLADLDKRQEELNQSYGKIPADRYLNNLKTFEADKAKAPDDTLREDWSIGIDNLGVFSVNYSGCCDTCHLEFSYQHEENIDFTKTTPKAEEGIFRPVTRRGRRLTQ
jgi:hypothetical protein